MHKLDEFKEVYLSYSLPGSKPYPLAKWLLAKGLDLYIEAFKQETARAPSGSPDDQLVRQAFSDGFNDSTRKLQQSAFFAANAAINDETARLFTCRGSPRETSWIRPIASSLKRVSERPASARWCCT